MYCPECGREMVKEYLFKLHEYEASYYHYVCEVCGYEDMMLYRNEKKEEQ